MSSVTDAFLLTSVLFDPFENKEDQLTMDIIHAWLDENASGQRFRRVDNNGKLYGGIKIMQASVWAAAFNNIDINAFMDFLQGLEFDTWMQVLFQEEEDNGFTLLQIHREEE